MTLDELARKVATSRDPHLSRKLAEYLRFQYGMNYADHAHFMKETTGMSTAGFEELMQEVDEATT